MHYDEACSRYNCSNQYFNIREYCRFNLKTFKNQSYVTRKTDMVDKATHLRLTLINHVTNNNLKELLVKYVL